MSRAAAAVRRVIKAYDVRGLVGEEIDEAFVADVGAAFARLLRDEGSQAGQVAIGYDMRESSPGLAAAFATVRGVAIGLMQTPFRFRDCRNHCITSPCVSPSMGTPSCY